MAMSRASEKMLLQHMHFPLFRLTSEWQRFKFYDSLYTCYSMLKGFTPCIDIILEEHAKRTLIINQTSLSRALYPWFFDPTHGSYYDPVFQIKREDSGRFSNILFERSPNQAWENEE